MTLQFALCNLHFAIAVRLSCPAVSGGSKIKNKKMSKKLNPIDI